MGGGKRPMILFSISTHTLPFWPQVQYLAKTIGIPLIKESFYPPVRIKQLSIGNSLQILQLRSMNS